MADMGKGIHTSPKSMRQHDIDIYKSNCSMRSSWNGEGEVRLFGDCIVNRISYKRQSLELHYFIRSITHLAFFMMTPISIIEIPMAIAPIIIGFRRPQVSRYHILTPNKCIQYHPFKTICEQRGFGAPDPGLLE